MKVKTRTSKEITVSSLVKLLGLTGDVKDITVRRSGTDMRGETYGPPITVTITTEEEHDD